MKNHILKLLTILLLATTVTGAQEGGVETAITGFKVKFHFGLGGAPVYNLPCPVAVTIENDSGKDFDGRLTVRMEGPFRRSRKVLPIDEAVQIPNSSKKRYHFCMHAIGGAKMRATLTSKRRVFWSLEKDLPDAQLGDQFTLTALRFLVVGKGVARTGLESPGRISTDQVMRISDRPKKMYNIMSWELPVSDAPLAHYHAVIFANRTDSEPLTQRQIAALARYVDCGGRVVFMRHHEKLRTRIIKALPLKQTRDPIPLEDAGLIRHPAGLGAIYDCTIPMGSLNAAAMPELKKLLIELGDGVEPRFPSHVLTYVPVNLRSYGSEHFQNFIPDRGRNSFALIACFFFLYLITTGPLVFIFRKNRRKMATYICAAISGFTVLAVMVALFLRNRQGEAYWLTVTELSKDGGVQNGVISMKSVGGRRHELSVEGNNAGLWRLPNNREGLQSYVIAGMAQPMDAYKSPGSRAFHITESLQDGPVPRTRHQIPLVPWGNGEALARSFWPEGRNIDVQINVQPIASATASSPKKVPKKHDKRIFGAVVGTGGRTTTRASANWVRTSFYADINLTNTLDRPLSKIRLVLGLQTACTLRPQWQSTSQVMNHDTYIALDLDELKPGQTRHYRRRVYMPTNANRPGDLVQILSFKPDKLEKRGAASVQLPRLNNPDRLYAVLVAQTKESPSLRIGNCDFVANKGTHYIVQRQIDTSHIDIRPIVKDASKAP